MCTGSRAVKLSALLLTAVTALSTACTAAPPAPAPGNPPQGLIGEPTAPAPASGSRNAGQVPCGMVQPGGGAGELCELPSGSGAVFAP
jgi:hypothetical protein